MHHVCRGSWDVSSMILGLRMTVFYYLTKYPTPKLPATSSFLQQCPPESFEVTNTDRMEAVRRGRRARNAQRSVARVRSDAGLSVDEGTQFVCSMKHFHTSLVSTNAILSSLSRDKMCLRIGDENMIMTAS